MRIIVYVEGPSDKAALELLLSPVIESKRQSGVTIEFFEAPNGDKKKSMVFKVPVRAANILRHSADTVVVALPDLYPKNKGLEHETTTQLQQGIVSAFRRALQHSNVDDMRLLDRFFVFCLKHDLEALVLAAEDALAGRLGKKQLKRSWVVPVEDQNHDRPPKVVVEELFMQEGRRYKETVDAPAVLSRVGYKEIAERCPQCFGPFVEFLEQVGQRE